MRSRTSTEPVRDEQGHERPVDFIASDMEICRLLSPHRLSRSPWSYQYLPAHYVGKLLKRSDTRISDRLQMLKNKPGQYVALPPQPSALNRPLIYSIGEGGIEKLREEGMPRTYELRGLHHELMASLIAASFEYAAKTVEGVSIELATKHKGTPYPDWPVFWLTTPHTRKRIFIEADRSRQAKDVIKKKLDAYFTLDLRDTLVLFISTTPGRSLCLNDWLKEYIDANEIERRLSRAFAFGSMAYDQYLYKIPKLTHWAVTGEYIQPAGAFSFMQGGISGHREATEAA